MSKVKMINLDPDFAFLFSKPDSFIKKLCDASDGLFKILYDDFTKIPKKRDCPKSNLPEDMPMFDCIIKVNIYLINKNTIYIE